MNWAEEMWHVERLEDLDKQFGNWEGNIVLERILSIFVHTMVLMCWIMDNNEHMFKNAAAGPREEIWLLQEMWSCMPQ